MQTDKLIAIIVAVSLPIVIFFGAFALCLAMSIICAQTNFTILTFFWGVAPPLILSISAMFPWLNTVPRRWALSVAGLIPPVVFFVLMLGNIGGGHHTKVLLALSPMIAAVILPLLPFFSCFGHKSLPIRKRVVGICYSIVLLIAVLWSAFFTWAITDSNFMGVSC